MRLSRLIIRRLWVRRRLHVKEVFESIEHAIPNGGVLAVVHLVVVHRFIVLSALSRPRAYIGAWT